MHVNGFLKKLFLVIVIFNCFYGFSQLSKTHYIPPLTSSEQGNANPEEQYIYLSTPSNSEVPYNIIPVGQPTTSYIKGTVSNINTQEISIGTGNGQLFIPSTITSTVVNNRGYIIKAEAPIYVSVRMRAGGGAQAGALVSKGASALGKTFRIGTYTNGNPQDNYLSFASVMATEDNTKVTFNNLPAGLKIKNHSGTVPINVTLNEGESYTIAAKSDENLPSLMDGLIGCLVTSDKDIVVNCGSTNGSFGTGSGRDYGIDQIVGLSKVGSEYIFVKGDGSNDWENVLIVPHVFPTEVFINGSTVPITITAANRYLVIEGGNYTSNGNMYVKTSQDVFAYQGIGSTSEANQGMFFVPPLSCENRGNLDTIANIENIGSTVFSGGLTIVTKAGAILTINSSTTGSINPGIANNVTGNPNYETYKVLGLSGNISVQSNDELYCAYFNYNGAATSGSFYSGFPSAPEINFDAQFVTLGNCIPNITLSAAKTQNFDSFEWWFDDGSGFQNTYISLPDLTPLLPGKYKLIGIVSCSGLTLESVEVPVSICPDDADNDGIIDNMDIDNDNDGILNCTESKGDVVLNLTDEYMPRLVFQDNSIDNSAATATYTQSSASGITHSFSGSSSGNFTSILNPDSHSEANYTLAFNQPVNVMFEETISTTHTSIDGEFFIARILPVNKNITLIDLDDKLLIDSNFDGIFETGITQISGSEIHFKINPSPNGQSPYKFFANHVNGFSFIHNLSNLSNTSVFSGNLSLTCFELDTDLDGIEDALDLDSDNDGIPDIVENGGTLAALSGIDTDLNGLDDAFSIAGTPLDSDNDSVYDFYDLDSDNDGIYDVEESGGGFPDLDFNGIIDNANLSMGYNGWYDNAETLTDSGLIDYIVQDTDSDNRFNYYDHDSDDDGCSDVIEAGFSDTNNDGFLGNTNPTVNVQGVVTNASDGYTNPNSNYINIAPIDITSQPLNTAVCNASSTAIAIISTNAEMFQWEVSTDGINWSILTDNATYSNTQTETLIISPASMALNNYFYRVKLDRSGNTCGIYSDEIILTVNPLPILNTPNTYSQCDDPSNDGIASFNLTLNSIKEEIDPDYVTKNLIFSFFFDANTSISIPNPQNHQNSIPFTQEDIWIKVEDSNGCFSTVPLTLEVSPSSADLALYSPTSIYQCDDGTDVRDGISTFDLSSIRDYVSNTIFSTFNHSVHFYESQLDAELEVNEIQDISKHQNTNSPNSQDIWVRVKSDLGNNCLGLERFSNLLIVESLPVANQIPNQIACDDDSDGIFPFDTSQVETLLLNGQNPAGVTIRYYDDNNNALPSPLPNPFFTASQVITIQVTNNTSNDLDGACFDETTLGFIVDKQPIAHAVSNQIFCDGDMGDMDNDGIFPFSTASFETIILQGQTGMEVYYDYMDENGVNITRSRSLPNPLITSSQTIKVEVINPSNNNCLDTTTIELIVNPLPEFLILTPQIVCSSDPTFTVILDPIEDKPSEVYTYEWIYQDGTILSNHPTLTVSTPGTYSITLTKTDGTGCSRTRHVFVNASEIASITLDDITIDDLSDNNTITIHETNLGLGDYEYALDKEYSFYQDEPFFSHVAAGIHTLYVRDKKGCGTVSMDVSIIGYPKYFTPNGDGNNDFWQILGLGQKFQANSNIYIFDRYGKLIKQLNSLEKGWDGTFNGALLPSDDYWFKVLLEDRREFIGHFSLKR